MPRFTGSIRREGSLLLHSCQSLRCSEERDERLLSPTILPYFNVCIKGNFGDFSSGTALGVGELISVAKIKEEHAGFLDGDYFVIKLELRLMWPENEVRSLSVEGNVGTVTVCIFVTLKDVSQFCA